MSIILRVGVASVLALSSGMLAPAGASVASARSADADTSGAVDATCPELASGGYCEFDAQDFTDGAAITVSIPSGTQNFTALLYGARGDSGEQNVGSWGQGSVAIGSLNVGPTRQLVITLGDTANGRHAGVGWSAGGEGRGVGDGNDGGGGGGSTGLQWQGQSTPVMVAGGGGGGGGAANQNSGSGGVGGAGGATPGDGGNGQADSSTNNGTGGNGGGASSPEGTAGTDPGPLEQDTAGGGGGGGGYSTGGLGGNFGDPQTPCNINGKCPPNRAPGGGGGGGGGTSFVDASVSEPEIITGGSDTAGKVILAAGGLDYRKFSCDDTHQYGMYTVPPGAEKYLALVVGGDGSRGHNSAHSEGTGAVVTGVLDVKGISQLQYIAGCSPYAFDGKGTTYAVTGKGGSASSVAGKDGGDGGSASVIENAANDDMLIAAGGGGGSGGGGYHSAGGKGGSGAGNDASSTPFDGQSGESDDFGHGGVGGCGGCMLWDNGNPAMRGGDGTHSPDGGGGGGGGTGYPAGGHGGGQSDAADGGGGGGAGASYTSGAVSNVTESPNSTYGQDGYIVLIQLPVARTSLTVSKTVSGSGSQYVRGPFSAEVVCGFDSHTAFDQTVQFTVDTPANLDDLDVGWTCTVTEKETGHASTPAPPQTITLTDKPASVVLNNEYATTSVELTLASALAAEDPDAPSAASLPPDGSTVTFLCEIGNVNLPLPNPPIGVGGNVDFDWAASWTDGGTTLTVSGVPINAQCALSPVSGQLSETFSFLLNGQTSNDSIYVFTTQASPAQNHVTITNTVATAPLTVAKATAGGGTPPAVSFPVDVECTVGGAGVDLPDGTGALSLPAGASGVIHNLPVGSLCTSTETDNGGATGVHYAPSQTITIGAADNTQSVTNIFDAGKLFVSIGVSGAGSTWSNGTFDADIACTLNGQPLPVSSPHLSFDATGGWAVVADPAVVAGSSCTVTETSTGSATQIAYASSDDRTPRSEPVHVTIPDGKTAALTVDNVFDAAPLVVTTTVSGAGAKFSNSSFVTTVGACTFNNEPIVIQNGAASATVNTGAHGGTGVIPQLVVGANCAVQQTGSAGASVVAYSSTNADPMTSLADGIRATINSPAGSSETPTTVTIDNRFDTAALAVQVTVDGAAAWAANVPYAVDATCAFNGRPVASIGPNGTATLAFTSDGMPIASAGAAALAELPVNAVCSAVESATGSATTVSYDPVGAVDPTRSGPVTVPAGGGRILIGDRFDAATLTVTKSVGGNDAASHSGELFTFSAECTFNGIRLGIPPSEPTRSSQFRLAPDSSASFDLLPVGSDCSANEDSSNGATRVSPALSQSATLPIGGSTLGFTNVFDVVPLTVRETLTGPGAAIYGTSQTFDVVVTCWTNRDMRVREQLPNDGRYTLTASDGFAHTLQAPGNAYCVIEQPRVGMASSITPSEPITTSVGSQLNELGVTADYQLATAEVVKHALGDKATTTDFGFSVQCTWDDASKSELTPIPVASPSDGRFTLRDGGSSTVTSLTGSTCTVAETDRGGAIRTTVGLSTVTSGSVDGSAATVLMRGNVAGIAFTNYLSGALALTGSELSGVIGLGLALLLLGGGTSLWMAIGRRSRRQM